MISQAMEIHDARLLRPLRSRPDFGFTGSRGKNLRRAHRHRGAVDGDDGLAARGAVHRHVDRARRLALARRLWADRSDGRRRHGSGGRPFGRAVPGDRRATHAICRAGCRRRDRRRLCHRPANCGDPVLRHHLTRFAAAVAALLAHMPDPQSRLVAGARRHGRWRRPSRCARRKPGDANISDCRRGAALRRIRHHCGGRRPSIVEVRRGAAFRATLAAPCAAEQGMDLVTARSLAGLADADADALSHSASRVVVAEFRRWQRRLPAPGAGAGHGGRSACRGLAWLAISGEDSPDLVASAPISSGFVVCAKSRPCSALSP